MARLTLDRATPLAIAALLSVLSTSVPAQADFFLHHWEPFHSNDEEVGFGLDFFSYSTSTDFDASGTSFTPTGLNGYDRLELDASLAYGFTDSLTAYGRLTMGRASIDNMTIPSTAYGFMDQTAGLNYRFSEKYRIEIQGQVDIPAYSNTTALSSSQPFLGDGSVDLTLGGFAGYPIQLGWGAPLWLRGGLGYTYRSGGFSSAVPWTLEASYTPRESGFLAGVGVFGLQSLRNDIRTATATSQTALTDSAAGGGSFLINAINPTLISTRGTIGYQSGPRLAFDAYVEQAVWGQDAPSGLLLGIGLKMAFDTRGGSEPGPGPGSGPDASPSRNDENDNTEGLKPAPKKFGHSNRGFLRYSLDSKVVRASDRLNMVRIDKGTQDGVALGQYFDIFSLKSDGTLNEAVARGRVSYVKADEAVLTITEYFKEIFIDEGFVAKRLIQ